MRHLRASDASATESTITPLVGCGINEPLATIGLRTNCAKSDSGAASADFVESGSVATDGFSLARKAVDSRNSFSALGTLSNAGVFTWASELWPSKGGGPRDYIGTPYETCNEQHALTRDFDFLENIQMSYRNELRERFVFRYAQCQLQNAQVAFESFSKSAIATIHRN